MMVYYISIQTHFFKSLDEIDVTSVTLSRLNSKFLRSFYLIIFMKKKISCSFYESELYVFIGLAEVQNSKIDGDQFRKIKKCSPWDDF